MASPHPRDFYVPPGGEMSTGDIWSSLPTMGLLKSKTASGIVITPACDLENSKVETITYLPVVPIDEWVISSSFLPILRQRLKELVTNNLRDTFDKYLHVDMSKHPALTNLRPEERDLAKLEQQLSELRDEHFVSPTSKHARQIAKLLECAQQGVILIQESVSIKHTSILSERLRHFFGKKWNDICQQAIRNAFSSDIHFFPAEEEPKEWSALPRHSVVLFRYPLTAPIEIFDAADDVAIQEWKSAMAQLANQIPLAEAFNGTRPVRTLRLAQPYLVDLLTRFTSLYNRLGSPSFSSRFVKELAAQV